MNWRNSMLKPHVMGMDARLLFPVLLFFFNIALWTLILAGISIVVFWILSRMGLTPVVALRMLRSKYIGSYRPGGFDRVRYYYRRLRRH